MNGGFSRNVNYNRELEPGWDSDLRQEQTKDLKTQPSGTPSGPF